MEYTFVHYKVGSVQIQWVHLCTLYVFCTLYTWHWTCTLSYTVTGTEMCSQLGARLTPWGSNGREISGLNKEQHRTSLFCCKMETIQAPRASTLFMIEPSVENIRSSSKLRWSMKVRPSPIPPSPLFPNPTQFPYSAKNQGGLKMGQFYKDLR